MCRWALCWILWDDDLTLGLIGGPYFFFLGAVILHFLRNFTKQKHEKYALTSVLLLNNLAGAFAREKMTIFYCLTAKFSRG